MAGAAVLASGSASLLLLTGHSPLWLLLAVSVFSDSTGTAAGILRTFMYLGAIASASLISLSFGHAATDAGLHRLAVMLTAAAVVLFAAILADRKLATAA